MFAALSLGTLRGDQDYDEWKYHPLALYHDWATFVRTMICVECNHYDVEVKQREQILPLWTSFSPEEIYELKRDHSTICAIWPERRELYRARLRVLTSHGVSRELITEVWNNKDWGKSRVFLNRRTMLAAYDEAPDALKKLCQTPGNEKQLASLIRLLNWDSGITNSFIFWYHKQHGDPGCKKNQFGLGSSTFARWWNILVHEGEEAAERHKQFYLPRTRIKLRQP
jgi:hypothetical protein